MTDAIATRGLSKLFGAQPALSDLTWTVPAGSVTALVGPNGAGKTTTVKLLLGLTQRSAGTATVLGCDPAVDALAIRRRVGFVPEDKSGFDALRVDELGRQVATFFPAWSVEHFRSLIGAWRIPRDVTLQRMSKGMRCKVFLALSLSHEAELLLLDEPTDGLDPAAQEDVMRRLVGLASRGSTVVIVTHRLSEVEAAADRLALITNGRLALDGNLDDLRASWKTLRAYGSLNAADFAGVPGVRCVDRASDVLIISTDRADEVATHLYSKGATSIDVTGMTIRDVYLAACGDVA